MRLAAIVGDRNRPQKHVQRARIVLLSADRLPVLSVARQTDASRPAVWRWQQRFTEEGVDGLLRDKTRKPGKKPLPAATVAKILALPCGKPPRQATHWTGRMVAKATGVSLRAVQRLWQANRLQPHRVRTFKTSTDPAFAEKVEDVVGLYQTCNVVVLPALQDDNDVEGFGIVLVEAAAAGKPVVATRVGGIPDAVEDGFERPRALHQERGQGIRNK